MLTIDYVMGRTPSKVETYSGSTTFIDHRELEDWLAYNRAYIIELTYSGTTRED